MSAWDSSRAQEAAPSEAQQRAKALIEEQQKAAAETAQTYREMDNALLLESSPSKAQPKESRSIRWPSGSKPDGGMEPDLFGINRLVDDVGHEPLGAPAVIVVMVVAERK